MRPWILASIALVLLPAAAQITDAPRPTPATFFGLHINHPKSPWPPFPFGSYRFWDDATRWQLIAKGPDNFDWAPIDYWTGALNSQNVKDATYILGGPPPWAVNLKGDENCDYAKAWNSPGQGICLPPKDLNSDGTGTNLIWRKYVAAIATHFNQSPVHISSWEVWQEFVRRGGENLTASWTGTNEQMVRLAEDARCIITGRGQVRATHETCLQALKRVGLNAPIDPSAVIIGPTAGLGIRPWEERFADYWATPGAAEAAEVVGLHLYPKQPEQVFDRFPAWKATLPPAVASKPIWFTEGGWHRASVSDPDMMMAFVSRFHLLARGLGVQRVYWYSYDTPTLGELMDTKAGDAYQRVQEWMVGNALSGCEKRGSVYSCNIVKADGTAQMAVWDAATSCSGGSCSTSRFKVPTQFTVYSTLDDRANAPIRNGVVSISAKPILLSAK